jgi:hypothetical protein
MRRLRIWVVVGVLLGSTAIAPTETAADATRAADATPTDMAADAAPTEMAADAAPSNAEQGLADVARAEAARRKTAQKAAKVYTNKDLQSDPRARPPLPAAPAGMSPAPAAEPPPEAPADPPKDEQYWRGRITAAREQLQRSQLFAEALQSRINALTTDFVNRDDPAQRAVIGMDRDKALAELNRVQGEIRDLTRGISEIEEEARRAGVPPGWLR